MQDKQTMEYAVYALVHDLQEPLRTIETHAEIILRRKVNGLDGESAQLFGSILGGVQRMKQLIHDTLELAKAGHEQVEPVSVDTGAVVQLALQDLPVAETGATIRVDALPAVYANQDQVLRLFENLLANAIKFRSARAPEIHVSAASLGREWLFAIKDNGVGIAPEHHQAIFEMFTRLHRTNAYDGSGLGLAICKQIVERHQGRIWVESAEGAGSTFYFTLPAESAALQTAS